MLNQLMRYKLLNQLYGCSVLMQLNGASQVKLHQGTEAGNIPKPISTKADELLQVVC